MPRAVIKTVTTHEPNISQRQTTYDLYVDGKFETMFHDVIKAMKERDRINACGKIAGDEMFIVDLEFRDGRRTYPQFVTRQEALAYAGRMAMDGRIARSEVRGLGMDAPFEPEGPDIRDTQKKQKELLKQLQHEYEVGGLSGEKLQTLHRLKKLYGS